MNDQETLLERSLINIMPLHPERLERSEGVPMLRFRDSEDHDQKAVTDKVVLVVGSGMSYYKPFNKFGEYSIRHSLFDRCPERISLVLFTGGSDISPSLYGEEQGTLTSIMPHRDSLELMVFRRALRKNIPCVGVCRGAQFLCAMAGGKLVQHVTNHGSYHSIKLNDGREMVVSSTHHQMMLPPEGAEIIGWADPPLSKCYLNGENKDIGSPQCETEIAYFPNINSLGMQYHPEMMPSLSAGHTLVAELVEKYLLKESKHDESQTVEQPSDCRT